MHNQVFGLDDEVPFDKTMCNEGPSTGDERPATIRRDKAGGSASVNGPCGVNSGSRVGDMGNTLPKPSRGGLQLL